MKIKSIILSIICLPIIQVSGQEKLLTKQIKVAEVIDFEKNINDMVTFFDQNVSLSKDFYPLADKYVTTHKPIIAYRDALVYLPMYAEYFYTAKDSIVRLVSYNWEKDRFGNVFKKQIMWEDESRKIETYNKEYDRIKHMLFESFGNPISSDLSPQLTEGVNGKFYTRESIWETEDYYADLQMMFGGITYRIRFKLYWKN
ncbi:hypothetical protein G7050_12930 [Dysgonomonas sp. HDW5A]|uniref:hypothetical protein n=1 Tax=Dysgonomonas sp. HDW5A TaxID=2714926 RepID=UPI00140E8D4C|nr:hypothetical protein [Dysgonomonas sp. HDW5A]QIK60686.1 hypothetical protein G7050_12930 [Dysgonomonas sp. HDW5A]